MSHDVFISYSTKDKLIADAVCAKLEESKIRAWIAPRDVPPGANFAESIINAIDGCKVFVLIWSANTNTSEHILTELNQAFSQGITIIPFRIQDVQPTSAMRYYIGRTHWLDAMTPPLEKHIASLKDSILANLGRDSLATEPIQNPSTPQIIKNEKPLAGKNHSTGTTSSRRLLVALLAAGGILLLGMIALLLSGKLGSLLSPNQSQPTAQSSPTAESAKTASPEVLLTNPLSPTVFPTITPIPTRISTPLPAWVKDMSDPVWQYINQRPPDVAGDDFSIDEGWNFSPAPEAQDCNDPDDAIKEISGGTMKLSIVSCRVADLSRTDLSGTDLSRTHHPLTNFVLQMDVNFHNNPLGLEYRFWAVSPEENGGQIGFVIHSPEGIGNFLIMEGGNDLDGVEWTIPKHLLDLSEPVTLTVINKPPYFLVYMDSYLLFSYDENVFYSGPFSMNFTVNSWDVTPKEYLMIELDNFRVWDLDKFKK